MIFYIQNTTSTLFKEGTSLTTQDWNQLLPLLSELAVGIHELPREPISGCFISH